MKQIANDIFFTQVEQELSCGKTVLIPLKGISMYPFIRNGKDKVLLTSVSLQTPLKKLDVVLFRYRGKHILHRIISIKGDTYIIQGDGIYASREICHKADIIGKVVEVHRLSSDNHYKIIPTKSTCWKNLSGLWNLLRPLRRYLLFMLAMPRKLQQMPR